MSTKLTLSIDRVVIDEAKKYAKSTGKSLSNIVEEYLKSLTSEAISSQKESSLSIVKELKGSVKMPKEFTSYQDLLQDALLEKYLGNE